ncbi:hypothetical protein HanIR_Chr13g0666441 [Helianthus annuus]|nr:hypothetical protein HanIR_Chr13g0666441 [Helianthus annuus]
MIVCLACELSPEPFLLVPLVIAALVPPEGTRHIDASKQIQMIHNIEFLKNCRLEKKNLLQVLHVDVRTLVK